MSACGWRRDRGGAPRPRLPAPPRPMHRRPARRRRSATRCPRPLRAPSRRGADRDRVRRGHSSTARRIQFRKNPAGPRPAVVALPRAPQGPRQNRSLPHSAGRLRRTPHVPPPPRDRPAASHRRRHARAAPCQGRTPRHAPRCARCVHANSQACSCGRRSCAAPSGVVPSQVLLNPRPAHLFMICSNIKLTWPGESIGIGINVFR
jgi:hypothetical protein